ncbi:MAG: hypothetical protein KGL05_09920 [Acidobacteriota bacterium]|nr:hypothetical protein [Acidobacteriota bacterium]
MMYMLIHAIDESRDVDDERWAQIDAALSAWLDETAAARVELHGSRLRPTSDATTVKFRDGETILVDGPFTETKEQVVGYDLLSCESLDEALAWAARHPTATLGSIEVRALHDAPSRTVLPDQVPTTTRYMMLVCVPEDVELSDDEAARIGPATDAWVRDVDARGVRLFGSQLAPVDGARTARVVDGDVLLVDGPFAETKELIAGFDILECADLDEALDVAARHPVARFGSLEVRPFW